ncbi:hypothetical protein TD95_003908 [Thielaviopsis punctulata]|uniref:CMP/dCMP-type deaminase domain-containing protein n=1 Tax=Thielaviopsis punctulata TaxID=72032 RepID=A0A0F4ZD93_9PEZI|nr:hypothetical protein TD95_003908 [Thielaviopsis punctulata]
MSSLSLNESHLAFMKAALSEARKSPPRDTNFCVGAVIVNTSTNTIIATGYTLEMPGNTHAEESALKKLATQHNTTEEGLNNVPDLASQQHAIYTTMEPCSRRLSSNKSCTDRILGQTKWLKAVYYGVGEPETFVQENTGRGKLVAAGLHVQHVPGLEDEILATAKAGHKDK